MYPYEDALIWEIPGQCGLNLGDSSDQALDRPLVLDKVGLKGFIATASGGYAVVDYSQGPFLFDLDIDGPMLEGSFKF